MKLKILFVDDDEHILASFRSMLRPRRKEWICKFAQSGEEALSLVRQEVFDMVIADMRMPGMDGAVLFEKIEQQQCSTVRVMLSGYSEEQALLRSVKHAHQFLSKPCSFESVEKTVLRLMQLRHILTDEPLRTVVTGLNTLPVLPDSLLHMQQELERDEPDLHRIADLVSQDVGLAATVMKLVNSTFFGFFEKITSPDRAVTLLGVETMKGLALGVHFFQALNVDELEGYSVEKLWNHSLQTGVFAKAIAQTASGHRDFVSSCFVAGLLHDIGKLICLTQMRDAYARVVEQAQCRSGPLAPLEKHILGVTHAEIGAYLLGLWGFDQEIVKGVYGHHSLTGSDGTPSPSVIVHVANCLQHELAPQQSEYTFSALNRDVLKELHLDGNLNAWRGKCLAILEESHGHE